MAVMPRLVILRPNVRFPFQFAIYFINFASMEERMPLRYTLCKLTI